MKNYHKSTCRPGRQWSDWQELRVLCNVSIPYTTSEQDKPHLDGQLSLFKKLLSHAQTVCLSTSIIWAPPSIYDSCILLHTVCELIMQTFCLSCTSSASGSPSNTCEQLGWLLKQFFILNQEICLSMSRRITGPISNMFILLEDRDSTISSALVCHW